MPTQPIPEQGVAVVEDREAGMVRVIDLLHGETAIKAVLYQPGDREQCATGAHKLAQEIIAKPAIVHMARVAWGFEAPRRLLAGGQIGEEI